MNNEITFTAELIKKLRIATTSAGVAVGEAALQAVAQDKRVTVRTFASALRTHAPMLGTANSVFGAALKSAKTDGATLDAVCEAMADAVAKKREDDRKRAAKKAAEAPKKALEKAQAKVEECKLALRTPLQVAQDELDAAAAAVEAAENALHEARAKQREAKAALDALIEAEKKDAEKNTEQAA